MQPLGIIRSPPHKKTNQKQPLLEKMGYIKFNWIPFELCIAPGTFQRCIDTIFKKELGKLVLPYLDDIIIYSKTLEEHEKHLEVIF